MGPESSASAAGLDVVEVPEVKVAAARAEADEEASAAADRATRALLRRQPQKDRTTRSELYI